MFRVGYAPDHDVIEVLRLFHDAMDLSRHLPRPMKAGRSEKVKKGPGWIIAHTNHDTENGTEQPSHFARKTAFPIFALLTSLLSSCADNLLVGFSEDTNYLSFNHPNSEKAIDDVRSRAERLCRQRKQVAIKTQSVCSLTSCATNYQCVDEADAIKYGLQATEK